MRIHHSLLLLISAVVACDPAPSDRGAAATPGGVLPQDRYVEANGVRLHYLDWGGEGEVMLFLPGLTQTAHTFAEVAPAFTDRFHVMGITHRGHGSSHKPSQPYSKTTLVADVTAFLEAVGTQRVVLVAHSFSGVLLPDLVNRLGERVSALVAIDAVYDWANLGGSEYEQSMGRYWAPPATAFNSLSSLEAWWRNHFPEVWGPTWRAMLAAQTYLGPDGNVHLELSGQDMASFVGIMNGGTSFEGLDLPMLIVMADDSQVEYGYSAEGSDSLRVWARDFHVPNKRRGIELLTRSLPGAVIAVVEAPHQVQVSAPSDVVRLMRGFLDGR